MGRLADKVSRSLIAIGSVILMLQMAVLLRRCCYFSEISHV